jgi:hypothetical protein
MPSEGLPDRWMIEVAPWVIQDGNYADFKVGQTAEFALEFTGRDLVPAEKPGPSVRAIADARYEVCAHVVAIDAEKDDPSWIIDFGLRAYANGRPPNGTGIGDWVQGETLLMVDHYWYFEFLSKRVESPELTYTWEIDEIIRETAPTASEHQPGWGEVWMPQHDKRTLDPVKQTDAWGDDSFGGEKPPTFLDYRLGCRLQPVPPKRRGLTAAL